MTKIKKSELKSHLQQSVQLLRETLDYTSYSYFILAMLFFYHVSETPDLYSGRLNLPRILASSPALVSFQRKKRGLREELSSDFSMLETHIPYLKDVLLPAILAAPIDDSDLLEYRAQLDQLQQRTGIFSSPHNFSVAYDYWITQLAKLTVKQGSSFYTPRSVIQLMVRMTKPTTGMSIYDPTVGSGGMFTECAHYINQQGGNLNTVEFYGCETANDIWAICKMNMLAHGLDQADIKHLDVLNNPPDFRGKFDLVLQNLPLSTDTSHKGQMQRNNNAFLSHSIEVLSLEGRGAILMSSSVLQEDHWNLWQQVVSRDWLETVISLPAKLLHGTTASANILVLNKKKLDDRVGKVLFIQASNEALPNTRHNELEDSTILDIIQAFEGWKNIPDFACVVSNKKLEEHDYKLSVDKYLRLEEDDPTFDVISALKRYRSAVQDREVAVDKLMKSLETLDYSVKLDESNDTDV